MRVTATAKYVRISPRKVRLVTDLIAGKEALGREKDLLTAKELRAIAAKRGKPAS